MPVHLRQPIEDAYEMISGDGSLDLDRNGGFGELIGDGQDFQHSGVGGLVEREVQCPYVVRELSP